MIDNKEDASIKKDHAILDLRFPRLTIWIFLTNALIIAYILIGVEKFRYKCTGCVILKYIRVRVQIF